MTTSESKGRFFLQNESIPIDSNRELECSTVHTGSDVMHIRHVTTAAPLFLEKLELWALMSLLHEGKV